MKSMRYKDQIFGIAFLFWLVMLAGCGGGAGGGGGGNVIVTGRVVRAETSTRPDPAANITLGGASTVSDSLTGNFTLNNVSTNAISLTVSAQGAQALTLPVTLVANQTNNLGDIFISDTGYNAIVIGRVVAIVNNQQQGIANATVIIAGAKTQTAANGSFSLAGLPVGLGTVSGTVGKVTAPGFEEKLITAETLEFPLTAGNNPLSNPIIIAAPVGTTPLPPYTITGVVQQNGAPSVGATVTLRSGGGASFSTTTDASGAYFFWIVPGTYNATATQGSLSGVASVTLSTLDTPVTAPTIALQ